MVTISEQISEMTNIRIQNFNTIIDILKSGQETTTAELSRESGLSVPTVKKLLELGLERQLVLETGIAPSTGGRKPQLYKLSPTHIYSLLLVAESNMLFVRVYDFTNELCFSENRTFAPHLLLDEFDHIYKGLQEKYNHIRMVGLSLPATVNDGIVLDWYYNQKLNNVNIRQYMLEKHGLSCIVENNMKLAVQAAYDKHGDGCVSFAALQLHPTAVGLGQMANKELVRGYSGFAGEIGHIQDRSRNIHSTRYLGKLMRNILVFLNPEKIAVYSQLSKEKVLLGLSDAMKGIPEYVRPELIQKGTYLEDVFHGLVMALLPLNKIEINKEYI